VEKISSLHYVLAEPGIVLIEDKQKAEMKVRQIPDTEVSGPAVPSFRKPPFGSAQGQAGAGAASVLSCWRGKMKDGPAPHIA
jgi:hypothetical protein